MTLFEKLKKILTPGCKQQSDGCVAGPNPLSDPDWTFDERKTLILTRNYKQKQVNSLTSREHELYLLLLEGFTLKECTKQLSVKYSTANTHITSIYKKLGVSSKSELIINYRNIHRENDQSP